MPHEYQSKELTYRKEGAAYAVCLSNRRKALVEIVPDEDYPGVMWRIREENGSLSSMANLTRAIDAAKQRAVYILNRQMEGDAWCRGSTADAFSGSAAVGHRVRA